MSRTPHLNPAAGFYGKAPSAGDFIGRRLPRGLINAWDEWMQHALPTALATGGGGGVWHFWAAPSVMWEGPISGAFALSRDRVGRRFPFLVALPGVAAAEDAPWYGAAAEIVRAALSGEAGPVALDALCAGLPVPVSAAPMSDAAVFWLGPAAGGTRLAFPTPHSLADGGLSRLFAAGGPWAGEGAVEPPDPPEFDPPMRAPPAASPDPSATPAGDRLGEPLGVEDLFGLLGTPSQAAPGEPDAPGGRAPELSDDLATRAPEPNHAPPGRVPDLAPDEPQSGDGRVGLDDLFDLFETPDPRTKPNTDKP